MSRLGRGRARQAVVLRTPAQILYTDTQSGSVVLSGSIAEQYALPNVEAPVGGVVLSGSCVEAWARGWTEVVSGSLAVTGAIYSLDGFPIFVSGTPGESITHDGIPAGSLVLSGSCSDNYVGTAGSLFIEASVGALPLSGSCSDAYQVGFSYVDGVTGTIGLTGPFAESPPGTSFDDVVGSITLGGSVVESFLAKDFRDAPIGLVALTGSVAEEWEEDLIVEGTISIFGSLALPPSTPVFTKQRHRVLHSQGYLVTTDDTYASVR